MDIDNPRIAEFLTQSGRQKNITRRAVVGALIASGGFVSMPLGAKGLEFSPSNDSNGTTGAHKNDSHSKISGYTAEGFEAVREKFSDLSHLMGSGGAAFAATVDGKLVVDLWGGQARPGLPWTRNTKNVIQSVSKAVVGTLAMRLYDHGELDLDAKVSKYWPEYAANGKSDTSVRMLLSHSAGSSTIPGYEQILNLDGSGFDQYDEIAERLANAAPSWEPGSAHGYHTYTYGYLVGELVYRITGRRAGEFLFDELAAPNNLNIWLGTPQSEQSDVTKIISWPAAPLPDLPKETADMLAQFEEMAKNAPPLDPEGLQYQTGLKKILGGPYVDYMENIGTLWNQPKALSAEVGAANVTSDARSIARLYVPFVQQGELDGRQIYKPSTIAEFSAPSPPGGVDLLLGRDMQWRPGSNNGNLGFPGLPAPYGPDPDSFGMTGGGGQLGFADPKRAVTCGFVRNHYDSVMGLSGYLVETLYECL